MNLIYLLLLIVSFITQQCSSILQHQSPSSLHENILAESEHHCVVIYDENETLKNFAAVISSQHVDEIKLLNGVNIFTHLLSTDHPYIHLTAVNSTGSKIFNKYTKQMPEEGLIGVVKKRKIDRTCLLKNTLHHHEMTIMILDENVGDLLEAINKQCETYFDADGRTTNTGRMRDQLLLNRYGQDTMPEDITCEYIDETPSKHQFLHKYLSHSRPVVIRNAVLHYWTALDKWTNDWLRREFGAEHVNIKLTPPVGVFEGVEDRALWNDSSAFVPDEVEKQLAVRDVVVVRPADARMTFNQFIDLIEKKSKNSSLFSAYLEYTSMTDFLRVLRGDAPSLGFIDELLHELFRNVWLSDGRTLGKLHFDQYDNLLVMVSGTKSVRLYPPWNNERLYEGHLVEAQLSYDKISGEFGRRTLMESTAMTMSPVDILNVNITKYPLFASTHSTVCDISTGDALYLPAYWWHEVQSSPHPMQHRNLAVNFWYEPFFTKEFPCAKCLFDINTKYRDLLQEFL